MARSRRDPSAGSVVDPEHGPDRPQMASTTRRSARYRQDEIQPVGRRSKRGEVLSYGDGRTCSWPGCATLLSRYNSTSRCATHPANR